MDYISLPGIIHIPKGRKIFDQNHEVKEVMICSNISSFNYNIAYGILLGLVLDNPKLANQACTIEGLYPLEVLIGVLCFNNHPYRHYAHEGDPLSKEVDLVNIVYKLLTMAPSTLDHLLKRKMFTEIHNRIITL